MNDDAPEKPAADSAPVETKSLRPRQPFTFYGVATFALGSVRRVLLLQMIMALLAAIIVVWFFNAAYVPSIVEAMTKLPDDSALQNRKLTNVVSGVLAEGRFLSFVVDLEESGATGQTADLQVELRHAYFQVCSIFGCGMFVYPQENIQIGRSTAEPWWGARQPVILALCGVVTFLGVWFSWIFLALIYAPIAKAFAYFADRELTWRASWRLVSTAQIPAALLMNLAIVFYGLQAFDLIRFLFFFGAHFVVAWLYVCVAPFFLPRVSVAIPIAKNPFE